MKIYFEVISLGLVAILFSCCKDNAEVTTGAEVERDKEKAVSMESSHVAETSKADLIILTDLIGRNDMLMNSNEIGKLIAKLIENDPELLFAELSKDPKFLMVALNLEQERILAFFAKFYPADGADLIARSFSGVEQKKLMVSYIRLFNNDLFSEGEKLIEKFATKDFAVSLVSSFALGNYDSNSQQVKDWIQKLPFEELKVAALHALVSQTDQTPDERRELLSLILNSDIVDSRMLFSELAVSWAKDSSVSENLTTPRAFQQLVSEVPAELRSAFEVQLAIEEALQQTGFGVTGDYSQDSLKEFIAKSADINEWVDSENLSRVVDREVKIAAPINAQLVAEKLLPTLDAQSQAEHLGTILNYWVSQDSFEVGEWIREQNDRNLRLQATNVLINYLERLDDPSVSEWISYRQSLEAEVTEK